MPILPIFPSHVAVGVNLCEFDDSVFTPRALQSSGPIHLSFPVTDPTHISKLAGMLCKVALPKVHRVACFLHFRLCHEIEAATGASSHRRKHHHFSSRSSAAKSNYTWLRTQVLPWSGYG